MAVISTLNPKTGWIATRNETAPGDSPDTLSGLNFIPVFAESNIDAEYEIVDDEESHTHRAQTTYLAHTTVGYQGSIAGALYADVSLPIFWAAFGQDTTTNLGGGAYQHLLAMAANPQTLAIYDNFWQEANKIDRYGWGTVSRLQVSFDARNGWLIYAADILGLTHAYQTGAIPTFNGPNARPFPAWKGSLTKGGSSYARLEKFNFVLENGPEIFYGANYTTPEEGTEIVPGWCKVSGSMTVIAERALYEDFRAGNVAAWVASFAGDAIGSSGYNYSASFGLPQLFITRARKQRNSKALRLNLEFEALYDNASASPATATIVNNKSGTIYSTLMSDSFNRSVYLTPQPLGNMDTGQTWLSMPGGAYFDFKIGDGTPSLGTLDLALNHYGNTGLLDGLNYADAGLSDVIAQVSVVSSLSNNGMALRGSISGSEMLGYRLVSFNDSGSYYTMLKRVDGANNPALLKVLGAGSNDTLKGVLLGNSLAIYRNGQFLGAVKDSFNSTATLFGLYGAEGTALDDFSVVPGATAPQPYAATDKFDRSNGVFNNTQIADTGHVWQTTGTGLEISSNQVVHNLAFAAICPVAWVETNISDGYVSADVNGILHAIGAATYDLPGIAFRMTDSGQTYLIAYLSNGNCYLEKVTGGNTFTSLTSFVTTTADSTVYNLKAKLDGATITLYKDGTLLGSYTLTGADATTYVGTWHGFTARDHSSGSNFATWNNFKAQPLALLWDDFNRADEAPTTNPVIGPAYDNAGIETAGYAPLSVVSNTLKLVVGTYGLSDFGSLAADVGTADVVSQIKIVTLAGRIILYVRAVIDPTDVDIYGYYVDINLATDNKARLYHYHGSPAYTYDLVGTSATDIASGDTITVSASGTNLTVAQNGTTIISTSSASNLTNTLCGISIIQNTTAAVDDWLVVPG